MITPIRHNWTTSPNQKANRDFGNTTKKITNPSPIEDTADQQPPSPAKIFADRVTIAGLQEAYGAKTLLDRIVFRGALAVAMVMISLQTRRIILQYMDERPVFEDTVYPRTPAAFPNISVGYDITMLNLTMMSAWMEISNVTRRRIQNYKRTIGREYTKAHILDFLDDAISWGIGGSDLGTPIYEVTRMAFREAADKARDEGKNIWDVIYPECDQVFSDCSYNGVRFDCCSAVIPQPFPFQASYQFNMNLVTRSINTSRSDLYLANLGLEFKVRTDETDENFVISGETDGYQLFFGTLPSTLQPANPVPSKADVIIHLAEPLLINETSDCIPMDKIPRLEHYSYYDPAGWQCQLEILLGILDKYIDCIFPMGEYFDQNKTCVFEQFFLATLIIMGEDISSGFADASSMRSKREAKSKKPTAISMSDSKTIELIRAITGHDSPCKPLCSRWTYPVHSSSFASVAYRTPQLQLENSYNVSWSRIRIVMPDSSRSHVQERSKSTYYMGLCDTGGIMGVYAGFSMITIIQVVTYGLIVVLCSKKRRAVGPVAESRDRLVRR